MTDPIQTPESVDGSGVPDTPGAGSAANPASDAPVTPEPGADAPHPPLAAEEEAHEQAAAVVQEDLAALQEKAQKADEYLALAQRTQADFENYRKRAVREAKAAQERGAVKLAQALLPAIDDLDRALAHADAAVAASGEGWAEDGANGTASLIEGLKHVRAGVISALGGIGIERYSPQGERFDPQYHEAVAQQPVEGTEPGVVVEVFQSGYRMGESVVRPARVVVAG